jgi:GntR family transcriptional regulator, transcriptional repressor for pyruvate dehydrogenase complex
VDRPLVQKSSASVATADVTEKPKRAKSPSLVDRVFDRLAERIRSGDYAPEAKLPGEHELAAMFEVSRPIVRDALARLRKQGVVYARQGAGNFVSAASPAGSAAGAPTAVGYAPVETIADIQRCYEFRLALEPIAAFYAAQRRDEAAIATIAEALALLQDATRHQLHRSDADFSFHKAITDAANNHYFSSSMEALRQHVAVGMHMHGLSLMGPRQRLERVFDEHREIYEAVAAGQPEAARDAMRQHLEGSRDRLFEGRILDLSL